MSDAALGILKGCLLALLYLFLLRVVLLVASELRGTPGLGRPGPPAGGVPVASTSPGRAAGPGRRERRSARGAGRAWRLVVQEPADGRGTVFPVNGELTIGRGGGCGIPLTGDTYASTVHARAYDAGGELWIEDLGSTNGTVVNDERLETPARLQTGDTVRIGGTVLEVERP